MFKDVFFVKNKLFVNYTYVKTLNPANLTLNWGIVRSNFES